MKNRAWLLPLSFIAVGPAFAADDGFPLEPGQGLILAFDPKKPDGGEAKVTGIMRASMDAHSESATKILSATPCEKAACPPVIVREGEMGTRLPPTPARDVVAMRFLIPPGTSDTLLIVENGYDRALTYRAKITYKGRTEPTSICLVIPRFRGYEQWPYRIEKIAISDLALRPWTEREGITCK